MSAFILHIRSILSIYLFSVIFTTAINPKGEIILNISPHLKGANMSNWMNDLTEEQLTDPAHMPKALKCRYHMWGSIQEKDKDCGDFCGFPGESLRERHKYRHPIDHTECKSCPNYNGRYIEYPITVNGINTSDISPDSITFEPVRVRPCSDKKTYFGIYLGDFPRRIQTRYDTSDAMLSICAINNPCIYVPELGKVVFGDESWWSTIDPDDDITDITDDSIQNQWYVKMLREMVGADISD